MSSAKSIVKNTSIFFFGQIVSILISFFLIILIARYLGDVGLGKYSFAFAFVGVFSLMSDFGVSTLMTRDISKDMSLTKKFLYNMLSLKIILSSIVVILSVLAIYFTKQPFDVKIGVLFAAVAMGMAYIGYIFRVVINVYEIQIYQSLYLISERLIALLLGIFVLYNNYGVIALISVFIFSNFFGLLMLYISISKKIGRVKLEFDASFIKKALKKSLPFWFTTLFITTYFKIDTVILSFIKGYEATGWYNAAYKIIDSLSFVPFVIITIIFPVMSKFHKDSKNLLQILYEKSIYYLLVLALPLGIGTTLLADRVILFVYKQEFANSIIALQILIWALVFIFINYLMGYLLNSIDKQMLFAYTTGISAVLNIILNFILIPLYSFIGAAIATIITELFNFIMLFYFTSKNGYSLNLLKIVLKPLIGSVLMGLFVLYLSWLHLLLLVPLSIVFYFLMLFIIGGIREDDKRLLFSFVKNHQSQTGGMKR